MAEAKTAAKTKKDGTPKTILLRNPKLERDENGKVLSITGLCSEKDGGKWCTNERTIKPQDAFQVSRCGEHQKKFINRRIAEKRRERTAAKRADAPKAAKAPKQAKKATG